MGWMWLARLSLSLSRLVVGKVLAALCHAVCRRVEEFIVQGVLWLVGRKWCLDVEAVLRTTLQPFPPFPNSGESKNEQDTLKTATVGCACILRMEVSIPELSNHRCFWIRFSP